MKKTIAITFVLALLCSAHSLQAQYNRVNYRPDSIRVEFPEQNALVIFEVKRFQNDFQFIENFSATLKDLIAYVQKASPSTIRESAPRRIDIKIKPEIEKLILTSAAGNFFKPEGEKIEITISDIPPQTNLRIRHNTIEQLLPPGWEMSITTKDVNVTIYAETFEGLENLAQQNFAQVVSSLQSDPKMNAVGKKSIQSRLIIKQGKVDQRVINYIYPGDLIFITGHAGIGLLHDKFYPELTASMGFYFKDHFNRRNHRLELIYNNMFFTEKKN